MRSRKRVSDERSRGAVTLFDVLAHGSRKVIAGEFQCGHPSLDSRTLARGSDLGSGAIWFGGNEMVSDG